MNLWRHQLILYYYYLTLYFALLYAYGMFLVKYGILVPWVLWLFHYFFCHIIAEDPCTFHISKWLVPHLFVDKSSYSYTNYVFRYLVLLGHPTVQAHYWFKKNWKTKDFCSSTLYFYCMCIFSLCIQEHKFYYPTSFKPS